MIWTTEKPKEKGWYWFKMRYNSRESTMVEVGYLIPGDYDTLCAGFSTVMRIDNGTFNKSLWCGPIPEPEKQVIGWFPDDYWPKGKITYKEPEVKEEATDKTVQDWMKSILDSNDKRRFDTEYFFSKDEPFDVQIQTEDGDWILKNCTIKFDDYVDERLDRPEKDGYETVSFSASTINDQYKDEPVDTWAEDMMKDWRDRWFAKKAGKILAESKVLHSGRAKEDGLRYSIRRELFDHFKRFDERNGYSPDLDVVVDEYSFRCVWDCGQLEVGSFCDNTQVKSPYIESDSTIEVRLV